MGGCAFAMRGAGARVLITEIDPICALQACMEGFQVVSIESCVGEIDIFTSATGNYDIITLEHMKNWKETKQYKNDVYLLPKALDEKVAALHLLALGAEMTIMTQAQADYIGVPVADPFKGPAYRY